MLVGEGLEDSNCAGTNTRAGVLCRPGRGCLGLGRVVGSWTGSSLAAFPARKGKGFRGLLLGLAFFVSSDPVGFLLPEGTEPGVRVGGIAVARGRVLLVEPGLEAGDGGKAVGWGGLCVLVRAGAGSPARLLIWASIRTTGGKGFREAPVTGNRGQALGGGGLGVTGFLWLGFTEGWDTLAGAGCKVGGTGFLVGGADFVKGGAAFWVGRGLLTWGIEGEGAEGLIGWLLGILVAVLFCNGWTGVVGMAGEARGTGGSTSLADILAGGSGVQARSRPETGL